MDVVNRRPLRIRGFDYSQAGAYFVSICARDRQCLFGAIAEGEMLSNPVGRMVESSWREIPVHFPQVVLDAFVVMPNHVHGVLLFTACRGGVSPPAEVSPHIAGGETPPLRRYTLGQVAGYFKYQSTTRINILCGRPGERIWQRNYYEHIVRNEDELNRIRHYIQDNPLNWAADRENPTRGA